MSMYKDILNFEDALSAKYKQVFVEECELACELFDVFDEANRIHLERWELEPERRATGELINRTFNDLHASLKLILEGLPAQALALLRDTIECANHIKLFEEDSESREQWRKGKVFFPRDIQSKMKNLGIVPPQLNEDYKPLSRAYLHPSKIGVASHTVVYYSPEGVQSVQFLYGGADDVYLMRSTILLALGFIYKVTWFIWGDMYPLDKDTHSQWYERLTKAGNRMLLLQNKFKQEQLNYHIEQYTTVRKILDDHLRLLRND